MRTTLAIDDDVLTIAKAIARQERSSVGEVISTLARRALKRSGAERTRNGVPLLPISDDRAIVTADTVNRLRDELA